MRLINTASIELERFTGKVPPYAILSHRWEEEEVTLEDMKPGGAAKGMKGYRKLRLSCAMAEREGLGYIWIDTCCIDKTSSAELSEAINSMFRYYREAVVCYTYLSDVASGKIPNLSDLKKKSDFGRSIWFTRGWTLQELIAPKDLRFYNKEWDYLGTRADFKDVIHLITNIPEKILLGGDLSDEAISRKMSWVSKRETAVPEDLAYCLLGVFDVNIPLLYGEGEEKAFLRVQEAILKSSDDNSIFLWCSTEVEAIARPFWGLLAKSPSYFSRSPDLGAPCFMAMATKMAATFTGRGVNVEFLLTLIPSDASKSIYAALISAEGGNRIYSLLLQKLSHSGGQFARVGADTLLEVDHNMRINSSKLPRRILSYWTSAKTFYGPSDLVLKDPQAMCFYVRQNPKISAGLCREVAGFYFDEERSLPLEMTVDDWSSRWNRWKEGRFNDSRATYLLEFETKNASSGFWKTSPESVDITEGIWKFENFGVLQCSDNSVDPPKQLSLCAGLQRTSDNFLNTSLLYERPFCFLFESKVLGVPNANWILEQLSSEAGAFSPCKAQREMLGYSTSFELETCFGRVNYLIKVSKLEMRKKDIGVPNSVINENGW